MYLCLHVTWLKANKRCSEYKNVLIKCELRIYVQKDVVMIDKMKLKSCLIDMKPVLQSTKIVMKLKLKWKRKRLMIGCVNHRKSQVMIVKRPQTKDKKMLYWYF